MKYLFFRRYALIQKRNQKHKIFCNEALIDTFNLLYKKTQIPLQSIEIKFCNLFSFWKISSIPTHKVSHAIKYICVPSFFCCNFTLAFPLMENLFLVFTSFLICDKMFSLFTTAVSTGHSKFSFERVSLMACNTLNLFWVQKFGARLNKIVLQKKLQKI